LWEFDDVPAGFRDLDAQIPRCHLALGLTVTAPPGIGNAASGPVDTIRTFYSTLLTTMKTGATLGKLAAMISWHR
jgi:hypothetical protein